MGYMPDFGPAIAFAFFVFFAFIAALIVLAFALSPIWSWWILSLIPLGGCFGLWLYRFVE